MAEPASRLPLIDLHEAQPNRVKLTDLERQLLNEYQKGFPTTSTPFEDMARHLGTSEALILQTIERLQGVGVISRVGPVFQPKSVGTSTLAAMAVPEERLESVAAQINRYNEVNHNYEREHLYNLWFVVTATDQQHLQTVLSDMQQTIGLPILDLPLQQQFYIDLGFPLWC